MGSIDWLDTETKAILHKPGDPKLAPPRAAEFALVLLRKGADLAGLIRAVHRINNAGPLSAAIALSYRPTPVVIHPGLSETEAIFGQFELICCDATAVFLRSEVLSGPDQKDYLNSLFKKLLQSPEFRPTKVEILEVPATESGQSFADQFLGPAAAEGTEGVGPLSLYVPYKKARIMKHWAVRIGARVECEEVRDSADDQDAI